MKINNRLYIMDINGLSSDNTFSCWYEKMPAYRKEKIDRFKPLNSKRLCLGAGILLEKALNDIGISKYDIVQREHEKPYISGHDDVFFNISHSGNMVALGISDKELGIDIEKIRHFDDNLINHVFSKKEQTSALAMSFEGLNNDLIYTRMWTMKEAVMKHSGLGISLDPKSINLSFRDGRPHAECDTYNSNKLSLIEYDLCDYTLTVCTEYSDFTKSPLLINPRLYQSPELLK